ncbi:MAG: flagellar protein FlaG [Treponema sp.]|nr:flagellar protein FlaG [Treponema sp.]
MPIASIGSSASLISSLDFPVRETHFTERRETVAQVAASLPGSGERSGSSEQGLSRMAADIANFGQTINRRLQFVVDQQSNEVIVKVIDNTTNEVVRVLPPEELQRLHRNLQETIGFLFNERV